MNSLIKGVMFVGLAVLSFLWFAYEVFGILSSNGTPTEDNTVVSLVLTALKLAMAISFMIAGIRAFAAK